MVRTRKNKKTSYATKLFVKMCGANDTIVRIFFVFLFFVNELVLNVENVEQSSYSKVVKSSTINDNNGNSDGPKIHRALSSDLWFPEM